MTGWTVSNRISGAFGVTVGLIAILFALHMYHGQQSNQQLDRIFRVYVKKLSNGTSLELATTEIQGAQRGLVLSYEAKDEASAPKYVNIYKQSGHKVDGLLAELGPLATTEAERSALETVRSSREAWKPCFAELVQICDSGDIPKDYALRSQNKLISAAMHAAAIDIVEEQHHSLEAAAAESSAAVSSMKAACWFAP